MLWIVRNIKHFKEKHINADLCNVVWTPLNLHESDFERRETMSTNYHQIESNTPENVKRFEKDTFVGDERKQRIAAGLPEDENIGPNN